VASLRTSYVGRFAPSPTGPLHAGSLVAALASWLDARAQGGRWLVRIEDVDTPRCVTGADQTILHQLAQCGLVPDQAPVYQSQRGAHYLAALNKLVLAQQAYPCTCSRKDIEAAWLARGRAKPRHSELVYPGTCRHHANTGLHPGDLASTPAAAWRFKTDIFYQNMLVVQAFTAPTAIENVAIKNSITFPTTAWTDRRLGIQKQDVATHVGDFVLRRADGLWAYQLAVVVDDALQGVTHVVRGEDLADNTARQILLQRALGYPAVQYLHTPLVMATDGQKLSKQNGAAALDTKQPADCLRQAATHLGMNVENSSNTDLLATFLAQWKAKYF
jgi:glutamyl-Q tRNA(Asp) synthetase